MAPAAAGAPKRATTRSWASPATAPRAKSSSPSAASPSPSTPTSSPPGPTSAPPPPPSRSSPSVLSDPQERAYYDSHRSQILFSDPTAAGSGASASPVPDIFAFFSSSAFSGFSDTGRGFYKVYGDVFDRVFAQELSYARRMRVPEPPAPPVIGNLDSPYAQVMAFYNYWLGFGSVMDFGWVAEWDAARGENRRVRRLMEEDNKKAMRKARREYNDAVRGLAAFCKKRDKRVVDMALKKKVEEEKKKAEEKERKKEEERRKKERAMVYQEPEWAKVEEEEEVIDDEEEEELRAKEELYCVACNKKFKSDKQWKNHEQSKKHRDKVAKLRMAFKEEEEALKEAEEEEEGEWDEVDVGFDFKPTQESDDESAFSDAAEELAGELGEGLQVHNKEDGDKDFDNVAQGIGSYDEKSVLEAMLSSRKNGKGGYVVPPEEALSGAAEYNDDDRSSEVNYVRKKGHRRRASRKEQDEGTYADNEQHGKSEVQPEECGHDNAVDDKMEGPSSSNDDGISESKGDQQKGKNSNPKKNKKGGKKKITVSADLKSTSKADQKSTSKGKKQKEASKAPSNDCETCGRTFESRNKLFSHLEETGHAMLKVWKRNR